MVRSLWLFYAGPPAPPSPLPIPCHLRRRGLGGDGVEKLLIAADHWNNDPAAPGPGNQANQGQPLAARRSVAHQHQRGAIQRGHQAAPGGVAQLRAEQCQAGVSPGKGNGLADLMAVGLVLAQAGQHGGIQPDRELAVDFPDVHDQPVWCLARRGKEGLVGVLQRVCAGRPALGYGPGACSGGPGPAGWRCPRGSHPPRRPAPGRNTPSGPGWPPGCWPWWR